MVDLTIQSHLCILTVRELFFNVSPHHEVVGFERPGLQIFLDTGVRLGFKDSMNGDFPVEPRTRLVSSVNPFACGDARMSGVHGNRGIIIASGCSAAVDQWQSTCMIQLGGDELEVQLSDDRRRQAITPLDIETR
jgi:hypothetical protein